MNNKNEVWCDIEGYEGMYQVSNKGRIKSIVYGKEKIRKLVRDKKGYLTVCLFKNGENKGYKVHRLVCQTFLPNPNNLPEVNHRDEDKTNNSVQNLEWCNRKYNINYGTHMQRVSEKLSKPVLQYSKDGEFVKEWKSAMYIQRNFGYNHSFISACCRGERNSAYGFIWKYK